MSSRISPENILSIADWGSSDRNDQEGIDTYWTYSSIPRGPLFKIEETLETLMKKVGCGYDFYSISFEDQRGR